MILAPTYAVLRQCGSRVATTVPAKTISPKKKPRSSTAMLAMPYLLGQMIQLQSTETQLMSTYNIGDNIICLFHIKPLTFNTDRTWWHVQKNHFKSKTTSSRLKRWLDFPCYLHCPNQYQLNSTELIASHRVWDIPRVSPVEKAVRNRLASVSGEWQVTASVTNESIVQLHLFNALLWRQTHSSLFVKLPQPLRKKNPGN